MFAPDSDGSVRFREATHLTPTDWERLEQTVRRRVLRYFQRQGLLERHVTDDMLTRQASRVSVHASVQIPAWDRAGLERLLRYCARPPFALERLRGHGGADAHPELDFDQSPGFDPAAPDSIPEFEFDQSLPVRGRALRARAPPPSLAPTRTPNGCGVRRPSPHPLAAFLHP